MKFREYFQSAFETSETHNIPSLRTRYYRCRKEDAMNTLLKIAKSKKVYNFYKNEHFYEVSYETSGYIFYAKIVSTSVMETSVDIKVTTKTLFPFGKGKKIIEEYYSELDKLLPFKGVSLFRG